MESTQAPDGIFAHQKYQYGHILEGLGIENVGTFCGNMVYFCRFGMLCKDKSGSPGADPCCCFYPICSTPRGS
jgi:hypothetical protein